MDIERLGLFNININANISDDNKMPIYHAKVHQDNHIFMVKYFCNFCELHKNHRNFCRKNFLTVL